MADNSNDFTNPHNISIPQDNPDDDGVQDSQNYEEGEVSGTAPDPESDDNVLDAAQKTGLYDEADEEHQPPLDLAGEIDKDEKGQANTPPEKLPGDEDKHN